MAIKRPTDADVITVVQKWIDDIGVEQAFKVVGKLLLYSGPRNSATKSYVAKYGVRPVWHRERALQWSQANKTTGDKKYTIIDQTEVGTRLDDFEKLGVYRYFKSIYGDEKENDVFLHNKYGRKVMEFASVALMKAAKGDVEALVYGATSEGVFYSAEIPALMNNQDVTSINGVPMDKLRNIYGVGDKESTYRTFQKICQGGLTLARKRIKEAKSVAERNVLHTEYTMYRTYFLAERRDAIDEAKKISLKAISSVHLLPPMPLPPTHMLMQRPSHMHGACMH